MTTDIKPDTSLYPNDLPSRFRVLALIAEGHAQGKTIQLNGSGGSAGSWEDTGDLQWLRGIEYRLKPEPRVVWVMQNEDGSLYEGGLFKVKPLWPVSDCKVVRFVESPE